MVGIVIFLRCHGCGMIDFDCQWFVVCGLCFVFCGLWFVMIDVGYYGGVRF